MRKFRTIVSVIIMILCGCVGLYFGGAFRNAIGGAILGVLVSGIVCIIYALDNQNNEQ